VESGTPLAASSPCCHRPPFCCAAARSSPAFDRGTDKQPSGVGFANHHTSVHYHHYITSNNNCATAYNDKAIHHHGVCHIWAAQFGWA
jgi:hypothetical protein